MREPKFNNFDDEKEYYRAVKVWNKRQRAAFLGTKKKILGKKILSTQKDQAPLLDLFKEFIDKNAPAFDEVSFHDVDGRRFISVTHFYELKELTPKIVSYISSDTTYSFSYPNYIVQSGGININVNKLYLNFEVTDSLEDFLIWVDSLRGYAERIDEIALEDFEDKLKIRLNENILSF